MTELMVGGDYIDSLKKTLAARGLREVEHWDGRKSGDLKRMIPRRTDVVVMLVDYVNHRLAGQVQAQAVRRGIPVIFSRHSTREVSRKLAELEDAGRLPAQANGVSGPAEWSGTGLDFAYAI
jgi:hypothetical protein